MAIVGVRREDSLIFERRAPLTPDHVKELVKKGHQVHVEPASKRAYPDIEYKNAGAEIKPCGPECDVILGVKQIPIDSLVPNSTSVFFSHTIKAQLLVFDFRILSTRIRGRRQSTFSFLSFLTFLR